MQLTESHKQYWSKNLRMTAFLLVNLVCRDLCCRFLRAGIKF